MTPGIPSSNSTPATDPYAALAPPAPSSDVSKNMFLQLLVAQIKNQDPLSPADGVQFLTQLAQFSQLEKSISINDNLTAIRADMDQLVPASGTESQDQQDQ
jgi:flagellar basal-body rod modification protein FlgD